MVLFCLLDLNVTWILCVLMLVCCCRFIGICCNWFVVVCCLIDFCCILLLCFPLVF